VKPAHLQHVSGYRVLLSEGSSSSGRQTLYGLSDAHEVGILDPDPLCLCRFSRRVHRFHRCPLHAKKPVAYLRHLLRTIDSGRYDVLLPTHEQVYLLARFREELGRRVALALPDFKSLRLMQNKADFVRVLQDAGLPVPQTRFAASVDDLLQHDRYPCYIKLPHSTAGNGVRLAKGPEDIRRTAEEFQRQGRLENVSEIVVQQPVAGIQSVVQTVFQNGRLVAAHCAEALRMGIGGGQLLRVSASHPQVIDDMRRLGAHLDWHGAIFLEYFFDPASGRVQYIEANPRIGETVNAQLCGVNLPEVLLRVSLGEEVETVVSTSAGIRSHGGFLLLVASAMEGAGRRQLLDEWLDICRSSGRYTDAANENTRLREDWLSAVPAAATTARLLLAPSAAGSIVRKAVGNYALSEDAAKAIDRLTWHDVVQESDGRAETRRAG